MCISYHHVVHSPQQPILHFNNLAFISCSQIQMLTSWLVHITPHPSSLLFHKKQGNNYELAEVAGECKERRLSPHEKPVSVMLLWPMHSEKDFHR